VRRPQPFELLKWAVAVVACTILVLPVLVVIPMSFSAGDTLTFPPVGRSTRWYVNYFTDPTWRRATLNSLMIASATMVLATVLGTAAALALSKLPERLRGALTLVFVAPIIVPTIVAAVATYNVYARWGLAGSLPGLIIIHTAISLPFVVLYVSAILQRFNVQIEQAARSLGASPLQAFFLVVLPAISPGIFAGAIFAFLTSFDEVVIALFMVGTDSVTLPIQMWNGIRFEINPTVAASSVVLLVFSVALFSVAALVRRDGP